MAEKRRRSAALRRFSDEQGAARRRAKLGRREAVLVEDGGRGYSGDYTPFVVPGAPSGRLVPVLATGLGGGAVVGTMCA